MKYIPELQKEVETLLHKKEKLWSYSSSTENIYIKKQSAKDAIIDEKSSIVSSVSVLSEKEAVIQLISSTKSSVKNKDIVFLSKVLEKLEEEEDGFILLNATTFKCVGEGMLLNTIHFQVHIPSSVLHIFNYLDMLFTKQSVYIIFLIDTTIF